MSSRAPPKVDQYHDYVIVLPAALEVVPERQSYVVNAFNILHYRVSVDGIMSPSM